MKKIVSILLLAALILCGCSKENPEWREQYDLGVRYLSEGNYEEAILAFSAAIEIDPNHADTYVLRADAYILAAKAEPENAKDYLRLAEKDYEKAEDLDPDLAEDMEEKREELEELEQSLEAPSEPAADMEIPEDAFVYGDHSYVIIEQTMTWEEAVDYCASLGGNIAVITSQEENDALYAYMLELGYESAYIGLTDSAEEGIWVWASGEESDYRNWHDDEPNGENADEDYAMFYYKYDDGTWNDGDFGGSTVNGGCAVICEWPDVYEEKNLDWMKKPQYSFDTFLAEKTYLSYWTDSYYSPAEYALMDLNGDYVDELIVISGTDYGFYAYQIYFYDLESGEIRLGELESGNPGIFYGVMRYSEEKGSLAFCCVKNSMYEGFMEYHAFDGTGFTCIGATGWVEDQYYKYFDGVTTYITYEEWSAMTNACVDIEFTALP